MSEIKDDMCILQLYEDSGIDESCGDVPYHFFSDTSTIFKKDTSVEKKSQSNLSILKAKSEAERLAQTATNLSDMQKIITEFSLNPLSKFASNAVYGVGVEQPKLLVITETPNADEDRSGEPLCGETGMLLKKILKAINSSVEVNTYTLPASPWRAPGGRMPTAEEMEISLPFVKRFIEILKPQIILTMGSLPTNLLLGTEEPITALRGKWYKYNGIDLMPTFALTSMLNNLEIKKKAWADLQLVLPKL